MREGLLQRCGLRVGVTGAEHGGKPRRLRFSPAPLARLLEVPMISDNFQRAFAVDFLFQSPQGFFYRFAFFKFNFGQTTHFLSKKPWVLVSLHGHPMPLRSSVGGYFIRVKSQRGKRMQDDGRVSADTLSETP